jgi:serine/threonine-protein kinase
LLGEPVGTASDIYSLGVLLYELLSGKRPYELANLSRVEIERILDTTTPILPSARVRDGTERARNIKREIEGDLDNIVLKAMHRDPQRRYETAGALAQDIQNYLDGRPVLARPDTWTYRTQKFLRRNGWEVAGITASILMICVVVVFYTLRLEQERDAAQLERKTADSVSEFMTDVFRRANPVETQGETVTLRDALDAAAARIDRDLTDQPRLRLSLMRKMGQSYSGLGLMNEAQTLGERSVALARKEFGDGDVEVARTLEALGHVLFSTSKSAEAGKVFAEAESIRTKLGLTHDAEWVLLMHSIGTNLRQQQHFDEAISYHRRAEEYARALVPPDPGTLGNVLQGLATTYAESGDYIAGERYAREALPMLRGVVYQGTDLYAGGLNALSMTLRRQYKLDESEATFREFLAYQVKVLGPDHWLVGRARNNFAGLLRLKGDYAAAEKELLEALRTFRLRRTPDQFDLAITHHNLGANYRESGDPVRALEYLNLALEYKRASTGPRSPQLVSTLLEKSATLREQGDLTGAIAAMTEAQSIAREKFELTDRRHSLVTLERGRLNLAAGKLSDAERDLREAVQRLRGQEEPARLADALVALGQTMTAAGNKDTARTLLNEALTLRRKIMPPKHPSIAAVQHALDAIEP